MSWCPRCRFGPRSGFTHPIINTPCYHRHVNTLSSTHTDHQHTMTITQTSTPSLSHRHQHNITATQTSTHNHQHTDINTQSLSHKRQHNFPVTQSCPARFYIISTVFSLLRIDFVKLNMWCYHGLSGPFFVFFPWLNFNCMAIGFFTFFT